MLIQTSGTVIVFACNTKSFAVAIIFFFFFFSTANLDGLTKVSCGIFLNLLGYMSVAYNSDTLENVM